MNTYTPGNDRIVHETSVDFVTRKFFEPVYLTQYDNTIPVLKVNLYYNGAPYTIPSTMTANIRVGKPDHTFVYSPALGKSSDGKSVYFAMTQQMLVFYGERRATIEIADANPGSATEIAGASPVRLIIEPNSIQEGDLESSTEFSTAEEFAERAEEAYEATAATTATATVDANVGTPSVTVTKTIVDGHLNLAFAFQNMKGNTGVSIVSVTKTGTSGNVDTYTITFSNGETTTFTITNGNVSSVNGQTGAVELDAEDVGAVSSVNGRTGVVTGLAEQDGYYTSLTAGTAEQILSTVSVNDKVPYLFRTSGGNADIGNRELINKLVGGTICWNQIIYRSSSRSKIENGVTFTDNRDGTYTVSTESTGATADTSMNVWSKADAPRANHIAMLTGCPVGGGTDTYYLRDAYLNISTDFGNGKVYKIYQTGSWDVRITVKSGAVITTPITFTPCLIDLTQMFGSTIADYIYSLEQSNSGDGVAFVRPFIENVDKSYNAGELVSVKTSAHETVGFNQWDEEWEAGNWSISTGEKGALTDRIRSKNKIHVIPGLRYRFTAPESVNGGRCCAYDASGTYIGLLSLNSDVIGAIGGSYAIIPNATFTMPENVHWIAFNFTVLYGTTYNHDVCLNISHSGYRDGEYAAYAKHTYALDSDLELRGIPKLDASNKLYYDGDEYASDGTVTRRYGIVDLGTLYYSIGSNARFVTSGIQNTAKPSPNNNTKPNAIVSGYEPVTGNTYPQYDKCYFIDTAGTLCFRDTAYSTAASFKSAMSGVYLVYELATPTTEAADPYTNPQIVDDFGTERYVDERNVPVPVGHDTDYPANLRDKLQRLPNIPSVDGDYIVRVTNGQASFITKVNELPTIPTTGTFTLNATNGVLSWVAG